jgi:hypothetical protein
VQEHDRHRRLLSLQAATTAASLKTAIIAHR